jgi:hypothetical protein
MKENPHLDTKLILNICSSSLSAISTLIMLLIFLRNKELLNHFAFRLIYNLTCSDFLGSIVTLVQSLLLAFIESERCSIIGMLKIFFFLMSAFWTCSLCFCLVNSLVNNSQNIERYERIICFVSIAIPLVASIVPLVLEAYNMNSQEEICWISTESPTETTILRVACFYGILWLIVIYNIIAITRVGLFVHEHVVNLPYLRKWKLFYFYPIILIFCWLWPSIGQILSWIQETNPEFTIYLIHIITPLSGLLNLLTFVGTNNYLLLRLKERLQSCFPCCFKPISSSVSPTSLDSRGRRDSHLQTNNNYLESNVLLSADMNVSNFRVNSVNQYLLADSMGTM